MTADVLTVLGIVGVLTGASALAVFKSKASSQRQNWLEKIESKRRLDQFPDRES